MALQRIICRQNRPFTPCRGLEPRILWTWWRRQRAALLSDGHRDTTTGAGFGGASFAARRWHHCREPTCLTIDVSVRVDRSARQTWASSGIASSLVEGDQMEVVVGRNARGQGKQQRMDEDRETAAGDRRNTKLQKPDLSQMVRV